MTTEPTGLSGGALQARIDELWDFKDPAASESRFRGAVGDASTMSEQDILMTQVARALGLQGQYAEGLEILDSIRANGDDDLEVAARTRLERRRILNTRGDRDEARSRFQAAFDRATSAGLENLAVDALHMIAIVSPPDEQLIANERAIALAKTANDPRARGWLPSLYNNTGWTHFEAGNLDKALKLFELALDERLKLDKPREIGIAVGRGPNPPRAGSDRGRARRAARAQGVQCRGGNIRRSLRRRGDWRMPAHSGPIGGSPAVFRQGCRWDLGRWLDNGQRA